MSIQASGSSDNSEARIHLTTGGSRPHTGYMSIQVKRPRTTTEIRALIRERKRHIASLEKALSVKGLPIHTRKNLQMNLRGEKNNMQSWIDYLEKRNAA